MTLEQFIGMTISDARRARNITQQDLASQIGMRQDSLAKIECGVPRYGFWCTLKAISAALHTTPGGLLVIAESMRSGSER